MPAAVAGSRSSSASRISHSSTLLPAPGSPTISIEPAKRSYSSPGGRPCGSGSHRRRRRPTIVASAEDCSSFQLCVESRSSTPPADRVTASGARGPETHSTRMRARRCPCHSGSGVTGRSANHAAAAPKPLPITPPTLAPVDASSGTGPIAASRPPTTPPKIAPIAAALTGNVRRSLTRRTHDMRSPNEPPRPAAARRRRTAGNPRSTVPRRGHLRSLDDRRPRAQRATAGGISPRPCAGRRRGRRRPRCRPTAGPGRPAPPAATRPPTGASSGRDAPPGTPRRRATPPG